MRRICALWLLLVCLPGLALAEGVIFYPRDEAPSLFIGGDAPLEIYFINVAAADAIFVRQGSHTLLVDGGTRGTSARVTDTLARLGVERLEYVLNTHPHDDHIGGLYAVLDAFPVRTYLCAETFRDHPANRAFLQGREVPVRVLKDGDTIPFGETTIMVYQEDDLRLGENDCSLMLHIRYGARAALLTADVGYNGQYTLAARLGEALAADVLKMPHHGLDSLRRELFDAVSPKLAVFTNHPLSIEREIARADARGLPSLCTPMGTISAMTDGVFWTVRRLAPAPQRD